jgi:hypothetical protein
MQWRELKNYFKDNQDMYKLTVNTFANKFFPTHSQPASAHLQRMLFLTVIIKTFAQQVVKINS